MRSLPPVAAIGLTGAVTVLILASLAPGCALDSSGLRPGMRCFVNPQDIRYEVTPCIHQYDFSGLCFLPEVLGFRVRAKWTESDGKGQALVEIPDRGWELAVTADCPDGDPMIYDVACGGRSASGSLTASELWGLYHAAFEEHGMPALFSEQVKALLRAEAEWPDRPANILYPEESSFRLVPGEVFVALQAPYARGRIEDWRFFVHLQRYVEGQLHSPQVLELEDKFARYGIYGAVDTWSLGPGRYVIQGAKAVYQDCWPSLLAEPRTFRVLANAAEFKTLVGKPPEDGSARPQQQQGAAMEGETSPED